MKKLLYTLLFSFALFINACETNKVSKIGEGVKVIGKCCKELSGANQKASSTLKEENKTPESNHNVTSILPAYFWDTKSMIW